MGRIPYKLFVTFVMLGTSLAVASPQNLNMFNPVSPAATPIRDLFFLVFGVIGVIFLITEGALILSIFKFRSTGKETKEPPQMYGSNPIELAWTVVPVLIVFVLFLVTTRSIYSLDMQEPPEGALRVKATGHQWWWEFEYEDLGITTAGELHVPKGVPVFVELRSADVIHSFWVPRLAGKIDCIPNRENHMWFQADEIGTWYGQCAEFCGTQHAKMLIRVISEDKKDFDSWATNQLLPAVEVPTPMNGKDTFLSLACINCHTVQGVTHQGGFGPDLTHLMSRDTIASGAAENTPENLTKWLLNPNSIKDGCLMPNMMLTENQVASLVEFLTTLK
ncbi:MAG: cytochrome c oxidase subunit II [Phycisphaerae bacterium]|nr:cytochrome c oxidase subunit II [Phycisphaerae bacterium]